MRECRIFGAVAANGLAHFIFHEFAIPRRVHVDKIHDHDPAHVAQPELAGHFSGRFQIGLEHGFILVWCPFCPRYARC